MHFALRTILYSSALLVVATEVVAAQEKQFELPPISAVSKVEIILTADRITSIRPIREEDLPNNGCTFTTSDNEGKKAELISIIEENLQPAEQQSSHILRNAVYLYLKNGNKVKVLLSDSYQPIDRVIGTASVLNKGDNVTGLCCANQARPA